VRVKDLKKIISTFSDESDVFIRLGALEERVVKTEIATLRATDGSHYTEEEKRAYKHHNGFDVSKLKKMKHPALLLIAQD